MRYCNVSIFLFISYTDPISQSVYLLFSKPSFTVPGISSYFIFLSLCSQSPLLFNCALTLDIGPGANFCSLGIPESIRDYVTHLYFRNFMRQASNNEL